MYARNSGARAGQLLKSCSDADVIRLSEKGFSPSQIGAALGVNPSVCSNILIRAGITPHHCARARATAPRDPEFVTSVCLLRSLGCRVAEIADALGRSDTACYSALKRWGGK